ncbi:glycosyltransferase [Pseudomonas sp. MPC6]|uniref:glycosyltransferase n=1 Tax=unclassified Pseudomonas TaxID=196821 RepID=UPI0011104D67|nr:glycosyltransferase [Pseudomonas sp. MPC6]QCY13780.1 glycosyltransferase [Pseudomonas sp. MPC6]
MRNKVALLGFYVGEQYFERFSKDDPFPQVAAYKLEGRFRDALKIGGADVESVASLAVSTYPRNKKIYFPGSKFVDGVGVRGRVTPLLNLPILKLFTRFVGSLVALNQMRRRGLDKVCVYAAHTPNLLAAFIFKKIFNIPFFVYVPDLPSFMDMGMQRSSLLKFLKKIDGVIINHLISASSGLFVISKYMVEDNPSWHSKPYMVLEGISESSSAVKRADQSDCVESPAKKIIFYGGGLNRAYGIAELVEGFIQSDLDYELWLCGRGDLESFLAETTKRCSAVKYLGNITPSQVSSIQSKSTLLVLTRDPKEVYTRYSFPSKLMEYMVSGVPVLTTRLDGIPDEYFDYFNVIEEFSISGISSALQAIDGLDQHVLLQKAACGKIWASETKSSAAVGRKIVDFMEKYS